MFRASLCMRSIMSSRTSTAPFSRAVVGAMRKLYPEELADKSWDNTGLLLEAPFDPLRRQMNSVLLTVDLTRAVADEAIERKDSIVIAYHPVIFKGLKSISLGNSQQESLLRLAAEGISVYSPHTAIDAAEGGLGDWLADIITGEPATASDREELQETSRPTTPKPAESSLEDPFVEDKRPVFMLQHHPSQAGINDADLKLASMAHTRTAINPSNNPSYPNAGMGRIVRFEKTQQLLSLIERVARGVGNPKGFPIAIPQGADIADIKVSSVGICAGSGGSLFQGLDVDLLFTGELSHHEALAATERGQSVICLFHSNTERGFLHSVLREQLQEAVKEEWEALRQEEKKKVKGLGDEMMEALNDDFVSIGNSEVDRDPFGILVAKSEK